jgi:hypothetical protein
VYVAFDSIHATNWCGELPGKEATTTAFHDYELLTMKGYRWDFGPYSTFEPFDGLSLTGKPFTQVDWGNP